MQTSIDKPFVPIGFSFIDSGYCSKILWDALPVYIVMRRYAWRANGDVGQGFNIVIDHDDEKIYCCVPIRRIAKIMGYTPGYIYKRILILIRAGWIRISKKTFSQGQKIYVLGIRSHFKDGGKNCIVDTFYADAICEYEIEKQEKRKKKKDCHSQM